MADNRRGVRPPQRKPPFGPEQRIRDLERLAEARGISSPDLDGYVHDQKASEAADINNGGLPSQLAYLCRAWGPNAVLALLEGMGSQEWGSPPNSGAMR